jgi:hypothetical protein
MSGKRLYCVDVRSPVPSPTRNVRMSPKGVGACGDMMKVRRQRSSFNVAKFLSLIGDLELAHERVDAGVKIRRPRHRGFFLGEFACPLADITIGTALHRYLESISRCCRKWNVVSARCQQRAAFARRDDSVRRIARAAGLLIARNSHFKVAKDSHRKIAKDSHYKK